MTAQKAKQISNKFLVVAVSALVLAGYQNCSKIKVADNNGAAGSLAVTNSDVIVATDQHDNIVPVVVDHPKPPVEATPTPQPTAASVGTVMPTPTPTSTPRPVVNPTPVEHRDMPVVCGHSKEEFENAIDVDQFKKGDVELKHDCKGSTLIYSSSGQGHLKGLNTGSSEGEVTICQVKVDKVEGKKGKIKLHESDVREKKDFKGELEDGDCAKHDNRDHSAGENNNRDHDKCKLK